MKEESPFSSVFCGQLREKTQCKICLEQFKSEQDFLQLHFDSFLLTDKNYVQENRKKYFNLIEDEICSKRNKLLRKFEKFQAGLFDYVYHFLHQDQLQRKQSGHH